MIIPFSQGRSLVPNVNYELSRLLVYFFPGVYTPDNNKVPETRAPLRPSFIHPLARPQRADG